MRFKLILAATSTLVVVVGLGLAQETHRAVPGFSIGVSGIGKEAKTGSPIPVKLTMTNMSDHDLHFDVMCVVCPPLINAYEEVRQVQVQLYNSEGNPVR